MMKKEIDSTWVVEKGTWCDERETFVNRSKDIFIRRIEMVIEEFLCICAGTINRWPECHVDAGEVYDFIKKYLSEE